VTVTNAGSMPLNVSSIATGTNAFRVGRASLMLGVGASDTLGVVFQPGASAAYSDVLTLTSNGYNAPQFEVPLYGAGIDTVALDLASPDGGEQWRYGTGQKIEWTSALVSAVDLAYQAMVGGPWYTIADSVPDAAGGGGGGVGHGGGVLPADGGGLRQRAADGGERRSGRAACDPGAGARGGDGGCGGREPDGVRVLAEPAEPVHGGDGDPLRAAGGGACEPRGVQREGGA